MNTELKSLIEFVKANKCCVNDQHLIDTVNKFFSTIVFSVLKDEWDNHMSMSQKIKFVRKLISTNE